MNGGKKAAGCGDVFILRPMLRHVLYHGKAVYSIL